jgi:hypothetical protein
MRLCLDTFWKEPAITTFVWLFTPNPNSSEWFLQHRFRPPRSFRYASSWLGLDQAVSGLVLVTSGPFRPSVILALHTFAFATNTLLNKLLSPQKQTPCSVFLNGLHNPVISCSYILLAQFSFAREPFRPWMTIANRFQDLFTSGEEYFSAFSHLTYSLSDFRDI